MVLAALLGRLPLSMVGLGSVLLVQDYTGSYGLGGAVAAAGAGTAAIAGPVVRRPAAPHAQRRVWFWVLGVFVVSGPVFLTSVRQDWPLWSVFLAAGAAGASLP